MGALSSIKKVVDKEAYQKAKEKSGFKTAEEISKATGLALPIIKAIDDHGIILTDSAMQTLAKTFGVRVIDIVKDALQR